MVFAAFDLRRLIHPIDPETFKREYWERQPLIVARQNPEYYAGLLSLADVDHILSASSIRAGYVRVLQKGRETSVSNLAAGGLNAGDGVLEALFAQYRDGSTIVLQFLHERWKPLMREL